MDEKNYVQIFCYSPFAALFSCNFSFCFLLFILSTEKILGRSNGSEKVKTVTPVDIEIKTEPIDADEHVAAVINKVSWFFLVLFLGLYCWKFLWKT